MFQELLILVQTGCLAIHLAFSTLHLCADGWLQRHSVGIKGLKQTGYIYI